MKARIDSKMPINMNRSPELTPGKKVICMAAGENPLAGTIRRNDEIFFVEFMDGSMIDLHYAIFQTEVGGQIIRFI